MKKIQSWPTLLMNFGFHFSAISVLPFWVMIIFFPSNDITKSTMSSPWIILPPIICYVLILLPNLSKEMIFIFLKSSPQRLARMMSEPWAASVYWAYAGAFDLFVGRWIYLDAQSYSLNHFLVAPILVISIFFGPLGFLLYAILKLFI